MVKFNKIKEKYSRTLKNNKLKGKNFKKKSKKTKFNLKYKLYSNNKFIKVLQ